MSTSRLRLLHTGALLSLFAAIVAVCYLIYQGWRAEARWWLVIPIAAVLLRLALEVILVGRAYRTGTYDTQWMRRTRGALTWGVLAVVFTLLVRTMALS